MFDMMLLLLIYILYSLVRNRLANRKCRITSLPCKIVIIGIYRLNPSATVPFYFFYYL